MEQQSSFQRHESTKTFSWPAEVTAIALSLAGGAFLGTEVMKLNKSKHEPIQNSVSQRTGSITCVGACGRDFAHRHRNRLGDTTAQLV